MSSTSSDVRVRGPCPRKIAEYHLNRSKKSYNNVSRRTLLLHAFEGANVEGSGSRAQYEGFVNAAALDRIDILAIRCYEDVGALWKLGDEEDVHQEASFRRPL